MILKKKKRKIQSFILIWFKYLNWAYGVLQGTM